MPEEKYNLTAEERLGPPRVDLLELAMGSIGSVIAGFFGGLVVFLAVYFLLSNPEFASSGAFPFALSIVALFATLSTAYITLWMNRLVFPDKYARPLATLGQVSVISVLLYICFTPLYLAVGGGNAEVILSIFSAHCILNVLSANVVSEILARYKYVLLGVYGSIVGCAGSVIVAILLIVHVSASSQALYGLVGTILMVNFLSAFLRLLFEFAYFQIYTLTGYDQLGNVFGGIEDEERSAEEAAKRELERF